MSDIHRLTISVVMPNYNHARHVGTAIEAIVRQSYPPVELIVIDDASTDGSGEIIRSYAEKYSLLRFLQNKANRGVPDSLQRGIEAARGDWVLLASADDYILPGFFEKASALLEGHPRAGLCFADMEVFSDTGESLEWPCLIPSQRGHTGQVQRQQTRPISSRARFFSSEELLQHLVRNRSFDKVILTSSCLYRRDALLTAGGQVRELKWLADWFAVLVLGFRHGICYIPEPMAAYRVVPGCYSDAGQKDLAAEYAIIEATLRLLDTKEFADVRPFFQKTSLVGSHPGKVFHVLIRNPRWWRYVSPMLLRHLCYDWWHWRFRYLLRQWGRDVRGVCLRSLSRIAPRPWKARYRRWRTGHQGTSA